MCFLWTSSSSFKSPLRCIPLVYFAQSFENCLAFNGTHNASYSSGYYSINTSCRDQGTSPAITGTSNPPMLMAVSCLSPVRTQILMSAFIRVAMVSGTPACRRSSMAVAPKRSKFCWRNRNHLRNTILKKTVTAKYGERGKVFRATFPGCM